MDRVRVSIWKKLNVETQICNRTNETKNMKEIEEIPGRD